MPEAGEAARMKAILDAVPDALAIVDDGGTIISFNATATKVLGYDHVDAVGRPLTFLSPAVSAGPNDDALHRLMRADLTRGMQHPVRTRVRRSDGTDLPVEITVAAVAGSAEMLSVVVIRSISRQLEAEERLRSLGEEMTSLSRVTAMGELAADIAHEINQPLAALSNYLETARLMLGQTDASNDASEMLVRASSQAQRAGGIIRRLQRFVSKGELEPAPESVEETVRDAVALVLVGRVQYDVRVGCAFDPDAKAILADRVQVQQVIVNLLRNAIDALQQSPPESRDILVRAIRAGNMVEFSVADTGPGIPEDVIARLYEPFYSTKGSSGMGVGLTISRRIVEAHGGRIWAENRATGGACFRFTIPLIDVAEVTGGS